MVNRFARRMAFVAMACCAFGTAHAQVVVSQVYGGGGNNTATLKSDFIELRNNGTTTVSLSGWSVQYASSSGTTWQRTNLSGSIAPGGFFLVKEADGSGGTVALPAPDATGGIAMSATAGKVALVSNQATLTGACPLGGAVVDFVGFGSANCSETAPTAAPGNATAVLRKSDGTVDTGNNNADFLVGAPNPRNSSATPPPPPEPALPLAIGQIQGAGLQSPYVNKRVVTEGIVTARKFNSGFFLQSANDDGDPATSDAVFVFTGSPPPVAATVGNRVRVTAKVTEFTPASNPNQLGITELGDTPAIEVLATGHELPTPIELDAGVLGPASTPSTLERYEAMRVSMASATVVGASDGNITESTATSTTDGVFYVTLPQTPVPFREPGIGALDVIPIPADKHPPRFDTNPERLMVRSRGQVGAGAIAVDKEARVDGLVGVLDYFGGAWALLPDPATPPTVSGGKLPQAVTDAAYEDVTIGGFNLLRFFDDVADNNGAPTLTSAALDKRLGKTSAAICDYLKAPDILGVVEVENLRVLQLLADRIDTACGRAPHYVPYLVQGNDVGGINVGLLVSARDNGAGMPRVEVVEVEQFGKTASFANPDGSTSLLNDRPPLLLRARVHQDNGAAYPVTVIVNHLRSLNGIDDVAPGGNGWASEGARVRAKRGAQAAYLAGLVQQLQVANPGERIVLVGDFNAFEFNDGYVDVLGVVKGEEAPEDQVLTHVGSPLTTPLVDGSQLISDPRERYSYVFEGNAQSLDHVLVNQALLGNALRAEVDHARINADFGVDNFGDASLPVRVSDHDPVRLRIAVPSFRSADLSVALAADPASLSVGQMATFTATVANHGPNAAEHAGVAFVFDAQVPMTIQAPAGWSCAAPVFDAASTAVTCTTPLLASGASATFMPQLVTGDALGGRALRLAVAAASTITDPANGNNDAATSVQVVADADLSLTLGGPALPYRSGTVAAFPLTLRNAGPDAAWQPRVSVHGDAPAAAVRIASPSGWACAVADAGDGFAATCDKPDAFASGTEQVFHFDITAPSRAGKDTLGLTATALASTPDPGPVDNTAASSTRIVGATRDTPAPTRPAPTAGRIR